jgi:DnaJ homolog subfamily A member 2
VVESFSLSLEDFYNGKKKTFKLPRKTTCETCSGEGTKSGHKASKCPICKGRGVTIQTMQVGPGMVQQVQNTCYSCSGKGEVIKDQDKCSTCRGTKITVKDQLFQVDIEKGSKPFQKVFEGESHQGPQIVPGDVVFNIEQLKHPKFTRKGDHLFMNHSITLHESLCGFSFEVTHLDNHVVRVEGKPGEFISPGQTLAVRGKGMPIQGKNDKFGDLFITFDIQFPERNSIPDSSLQELSKILPAPKTTPSSQHFDSVKLSTTSRTEIQQIERNEEREQSQRQKRRERSSRNQQGGENVECQQQ